MTAGDGIDSVPGSVPDLLVIGGCMVSDAGTNSSVSSEAIGVLVADGRVTEIGPPELLRSRGPRAEIGDTSCLISPGLVNAHHHQAVTPFQRGIFDDRVEPWLAGQVGLPMLDPGLDAALGTIQMLRSGITTVLHNQATAWLSPEHPLEDSCSIIDAYRSAGMRLAFSVSARDQHPLVYGDPSAHECGGLDLAPPPTEFDLDSHLALVEQLHLDEHHGSTQIMVSPHNAQWCSDELLMAQHGLAERLGLRIHLHLQETSHQLEYGHRMWARSPLAHLDDIGFLGPHVSVAHAVWLDPGDAELLAARGVSVSHNPSSNLRLRSGIAPISRLAAAGVNVAIGLDQAGINDDQDMFAELRLAMRLAPERDARTTIGAADVFHMATRGGAQVLGDEGTGGIQLGGAADLVLVDMERLSQPFLHPDHSPVDALVYRAGPVDVRSVVIDGVVRMRDRHVVGLDVDGTIAELSEHMERSMRAVGLVPGRRLAAAVRSWFDEWPTPR